MLSSLSASMRRIRSRNRRRLVALGGVLAAHLEQLIDCDQLLPRLGIVSGQQRLEIIAALKKPCGQQRPRRRLGPIRLAADPSAQAPRPWSPRSSISCNAGQRLENWHALFVCDHRDDIASASAFVALYSGSCATRTRPMPPNSASIATSESRSRISSRSKRSPR